MDSSGGFCLMEIRFTTPPRLKAVVGTPCIAPCGCTRPAVSRGLCTGHHHQERRGATLTVLRKIRPARARDAQGRKECGTCRVWKPVADYTVDRKQADGLLNNCRRCTRSTTLQRKYGITADEFDEMLALQGGVCAICRAPSSRDGYELAVDHDHRCCPGSRSCSKCLRGLLCSSCNLALGLLKSDINRLKSMLAYEQRRLVRVHRPRVLLRPRSRQPSSGPARRTSHVRRQRRVVTRP